MKFDEKTVVGGGQEEIAGVATGLPDLSSAASMISAGHRVVLLDGRLFAIDGQVVTQLCLPATPAVPAVATPLPRPSIPLRHTDGAVALTLAEAGEMLGGISAATVKREIYRGHLRGLKVGRQWRVRVGEIHAYLKRQETA